MQYLDNQWLGLVLLAWAVLSVIWLTLLIGVKNDAQEDARAAAASRNWHRDARLQESQRVYALMQELKTANQLISQLSFELDRTYVADVAAVPPAAPLVSNTDKVLAYYRT